jgi:3-dehydroquinate dehydratase-1
MQGRPISVRGRALPYPAVCAPLVARTSEALIAECSAVAAKKPDLIEWRVDFFEAIGDAQQVIATAKQLKGVAAGIPILFTRRSVREGGEKIAIGEEQVVALYRSVCGSGLIDLADFEMESDPAHLDAVREASRRAGVPLVLSFHDFLATPSLGALVQRFERMQSLGADVAKIAVMPRSMNDVLALLGATSQAAARCTIPLVSMAMGAMGAVTRTSGWLFGSAMTFAVGASSSAPGQMPIEDVRAAIEVLQKALSPRP